MGCGSSKSAAIGNDISDSQSDEDNQVQSENNDLFHHEILNDSAALSDILQSDDPTINGYHILSEIACGPMSRVFQVIKEDSKELCVAKIYSHSVLKKKRISNDDQPYVLVQRELDILSKLSHKYVIILNEAFDDTRTNSLVIVMPYCPLGSLKHLLSQNLLNTNTISKCFYQIATACEYLHSNLIVHRDIKPANILAFNLGHFVLSDFSVSQEVAKQSSYATDVKGTPMFMAPEECRGTKFHPIPADVWAYGVSLYMSLFGHLPFDLESCQGFLNGGGILALYKHIHSNDLIIPPDTPSNLVSLLKGVLEKDPAKRLTFKAIVLHPYFEELHANATKKRKSSGILD